MLRTKLAKLVLATTLLLSTAAYAEDISFEASVNRNEVSVKGSVQLTLTIRGTQNADHIILPKIDGFESNYIGPSRQVSIVNGSYTSSVAFNYILYPLKEGSFSIPALEVNISGQPYRSKPIPIKVVASESQVSQNTLGDLSLSIKDKVYVALKAAKEEVYLGEGIPIKVLLFINEVSVRDVQYPQLDSLGLRIEEYQKPKQYKQNIQGRIYHIVEYNTTAYPTREGEITLGPAKVECNVLFKVPGQSSLGRMDSLFNDEFFNNFFDRYDKRPISLMSDTVKIKVNPLPKANQPKDFSQAVGQFMFDAQVSPTQLKVGDPITLRMNVKGEGNLNAVQMPRFSDEENFKLYEPIIKEENGVKTLEQVIIPKSEDVIEVGPINFSFFDVALNRYNTITRGPFPIQVEEGDGGGDLKVVGLNGQERIDPIESFGEDIVFIKENFGRIQPRGYRIYTDFKLYLVIFFVVMVFFLSLSHYKRNHRLETDVVYARRLQAPREAKKGLNEAKQLLAQGKKEEFYDTVFKVLTNYLGKKLHLPAGSVTLEKIKAKLGESNQSKKALSDIKIIFEECDSVRYASAQINEQHMQKSYERLQSAIDFIQRSVK